MRVLRAALSAVALLCGAGCAVGPDFVRPAPPTADHYNRGGDPPGAAAVGGDDAQRFVPQAPPAEWWRLLGSPAVDAIVAQALENNLDARIAAANLRESQDDLRAGWGTFFPQVDGSGVAERQRISPLRFGQNAPGSIFNLYTLSGTVGYSLDWFGAERRAVEGLRAQVDLRRQILAATYAALTANIVGGIVARAAYQSELEASGRIIADVREEVAIAQAQADAGAAPYAAVLSLQTQLASAEAGHLALAQKVDQAEHLLAVLVGQAPADWAAPPVRLDDLRLPQSLPIELPSDLVRQRPDILAAEAELHAASAAVGVATAALYPSLTLSAAYGGNATTIGAVGGAGARFWSATGGLTAPLFHGGSLRYKRRAAVDAYDAALAGYRKTVLSAFAQVADVLRALEHDALIVHAATDADGAALRAAQLTEANYQAGVAGYLQLLTAEAQRLQAANALTDAVALRYQDTVALFVAMGCRAEPATR